MDRRKQQRQGAAPRRVGHQDAHAAAIEIAARELLAYERVDLTAVSTACGPPMDATADCTGAVMVT